MLPGIIPFAHRIIGVGNINRIMTGADSSSISSQIGRLKKIGLPNSTIRCANFIPTDLPPDITFRKNFQNESTT
jgi:hypothetical protein